jgi:hypothetical protein
MFDRQLTRGDDALGLVADVEQDLVPVDLHDGAFDDVAVIEILNGLVDRGEEGLLGAEVVDCDRHPARCGGRCGAARGGLDAARHVGCCSGGLNSRRAAGSTVTLLRPGPVVTHASESVGDHGSTAATASLLPSEVAAHECINQLTVRIRARSNPRPVRTRYQSMDTAPAMLCPTAIVAIVEPRSAVWSSS